MNVYTETTLPVNGMSCASCVAKIEKALKNTPGVATARVNLAAARASVEYDSSRLGLPELAQVIQGLGYRVAWDHIDLLVLGVPGLNGAENVVRALPGVVEVRGDPATDSLGIDFAGAVVSSAEIKKAVRGLGYQVSEKGQGETALDRERDARQHEIRMQLLNLLVATPLASLIMLGTFRDYWVLDAIMPR